MGATPIRASIVNEPVLYTVFCLQSMLSDTIKLMDEPTPSTPNQPKRPDITSLYPAIGTGEKPPILTSATGAPIYTHSEDEPKPRRHTHLQRNIFLATTVLSLVLLFAWSPINHQLLHLPIDFGMLTALCLFLLTAFFISFAKLAHCISKIISNRANPSLIYHITISTFILAAFLGAGYFEFRHQFVQILTTPIIRKVSGVPTALTQCDRVTANLLAPTRSGYVEYGSAVAHFHPSACADIFDWYVWQHKTDTTREQIHKLDMITHEATHVGGEYNELNAKCASTEWLEEALLDIGVDEKEARDIAIANRHTANDFKYGGIGSQQHQYEGSCDDLPRFRDSQIKMPWLEP